MLHVEQIPWIRVRVFGTRAAQFALERQGAAGAATGTQAARRSPQAEYAHLVASGQIMEDKGQVEAVRHLQRLYEEVVTAYGAPGAGGPRCVSPGHVAIAMLDSSLNRISGLHTQCGAQRVQRCS